MYTASADTSYTDSLGEHLYLDTDADDYVMAKVKYQRNPVASKVINFLASIDRTSTIAMITDVTLKQLFVHYNTSLSSSAPILNVCLAQHTD